MFDNIYQNFSCYPLLKKVSCRPSCMCVHVCRVLFNSALFIMPKTLDGERLNKLWYAYIYTLYIQINYGKHT